MKASSDGGARIINWDTVVHADLDEYVRSRDPKLSRKLVSSFIKADSLFSDPQFCPIDLILKHFYMMQVAISDLVEENRLLRDLSQIQKKAISEAHRKTAVHESIKPSVVFSCPFCQKPFRSSDYLRSHIERRHSSCIHTKSKNTPNSKPIISRTVELNRIPDKTVEEEVKSSLNHFKMKSQRDSEAFRVEVCKKIGKIEEMVEDIAEAKRNARQSKAKENGNNPFRGAGKAAAVPKISNTQPDQNQSSSSDLETIQIAAPKPKS